MIDAMPYEKLGAGSDGNMHQKLGIEPRYSVDRMPETSNKGIKPDGSEDISGRRDFIPLQVRTVRTWNELEAIRPAWESILQGAEALTIFSTLEWLGAWWKAFAKDKELIAPVFSNADGEIV